MLLSLQSHHIVDLYYWVDELLPKHLPNPAGGRPAILTPSELITVLIWNTLVVQQQTLKGIYDWLCMYHRKEFPQLPTTYQGFVAACHRAAPLCLYVMQQLLCTTEPIRIVDSTMLPVCKRQRADSHKVAQNIARFGRNHQGWHFGFKLHAAIDLKGALCALALTPANAFDAHLLVQLLNEHTKIAVGDTTYGARVMREIIWERYGTVIIAPPHPKQTKKIAALWQNELLSMRSKIEAVFDVLKQHLHLVTSFARSVKGYLLHYIRILLSYQIVALALA